MKCSRFFLVVLLVLCSVPLLAAKKDAPPEVTESEVWFDDISKPMPLTTEQGIALVKQLRDGMLAGKSVKEILAGISYDDPSPRVLFITLGDGSFPGRTYYASGTSFKDALARLLAIVAKREPEYAEAIRGELEGQVARAKEEFNNMSDEERRKAPPNPLLQVPLPEYFRRKMENPLMWNSLRMDVVQATLPVKNFQITRSRLLLTSAVGIAFDPVAAFAFTPEQLKGRCLVTGEHQLSVSAIGNLIAETNLWSAWQLWSKMAAAPTGFNVSIFECDSYYVDAARAMRLFRGHPLDVAEKSAAADVKGSARALARRLGRMLKENGKYDQPFLEWFAARADGKPSVTDQAQLTLGLVRTALTQDLPPGERQELLNAARAAAKPVLKSIKHFDPGELGPDFINSTAPRKPAAQRLYAATVEDENQEDNGPDQMEIPRRLMEISTCANAYLALAELWQALPNEDATARACMAELPPLFNYILTQVHPNGEFVAARFYPDYAMLLEEQPDVFGRAEILSLCGLVWAKHLELFPEKAEELQLKEKLREMCHSIIKIALEDRDPGEYPFSPWLAEILAQDNDRNPECLAQLMRLGMAAADGLEKAPFLPDMFGASTDVPSMTYAAERLWIVSVAAEVIGRNEEHAAEAEGVLREAWPLFAFMQQAEVDNAVASALPRPSEYVGFYRDNLADFGFTMNGQVTQLLTRLNLATALSRLQMNRLEPLPEDAEAYSACWKGIDRHPVVLAPELVIQSAVAGSGNDRALGGRFDVSGMQSRQLTGEEL
ncbi:MAG: hypothetical protein II943_10245 [Victivallales bacterium]|nr:hypothetical protein [Victivallales bacterium]